MDRELVKMVLKILCLALAVQLIHGASQCLRTNSDPAQHCTDECTIQSGCRNSRKKCLCDGDCGYSCVYPKKRCSKPKTIRNGQIIFKRYRFNDTQRAVCKAGFKLAGSAVRTCRGIGYWDGRQARCKRPQTNCNDPGTQGLLLRFTPAKKSFKFGTKLIYYCPDKFILQGASTLVCKKDGSWSSALPKCTARKCNPAALPAHTQVLQPRNWKTRRSYGVRITLSCDYGYTSTQRGTLVCDPPGWRLEPGSFKCFPKSCPDPGTPKNGNRKGLFRFGEKVTYSCDKCYKLSGPAYRTCQADQTWTDNLPKCEPVTCSFLNPPVNGYLAFNMQQCDSIVQYHCDFGYHLIGSSRRRCQSDGTWTGSEPKCEIQSCPDPGTPWRGTRKGSFLVGQTVTFSCDSCYTMSGNSKRTCQSDQTWTGRQPTCHAIRCSGLSRPKNGKISSYATGCGTVVTFRCDAGYTLQGDSSRRCQSNKRWTGQSPTCVVPFTRTGVPTSQSTSRMATTASASQGSTRMPKGQLTSKSSTGLAVTTYSTTTSSTTQLLPTTMTSHPLCGRPTLSFGTTVRLQRRNGSLLVIGCKLHFSSVQSTGIMKCNFKKKKWETLRSIKCVAKGCSEPDIPKNGFKHGASYFFDDEVTYTCDACYRLTGASKRTCLTNSSWSGAVPKCIVKKCGPLSHTFQATVSYMSDECKSIATYTCSDSRLTMLGSGQKICNTSGVWHGKEPKCIDPSHDVNIALNKTVSMSSSSVKWRRSKTYSSTVNGIRKGGFVHTKREYGPWWKVDLGKEESVSTVIMVSRFDCCVQTMNNFKVSVGNNAKGGKLNTECGGKYRATSVNIVHCRKQLKGRYVFVYLPSNRYTFLVLTEVEVYRNKLVE